MSVCMNTQCFQTVDSTLWYLLSKNRTITSEYNLSTALESHILGTVETPSLFEDGWLWDLSMVCDAFYGIKHPHTHHYITTTKAECYKMYYKVLEPVSEPQYLPSLYPSLSGVPLSPDIKQRLWVTLYRTSRSAFHWSFKPWHIHTNMHAVHTIDSSMLGYTLLRAVCCFPSFICSSDIFLFLHTDKTKSSCHHLSTLKLQLFSKGVVRVWVPFTHSSSFSGSSGNWVALVSSPVAGSSSLPDPCMGRTVTDSTGSTPPPWVRRMVGEATGSTPPVGLMVGEATGSTPPPRVGLMVGEATGSTPPPRVGLMVDEATGLRPPPRVGLMVDDTTDFELQWCTFDLSFSFTGVIPSWDESFCRNLFSIYKHYSTRLQWLITF